MMCDDLALVAAIERGCAAAGAMPGEGWLVVAPLMRHVTSGLSAADLTHLFRRPVDAGLLVMLRRAGVLAEIERGRFVLAERWVMSRDTDGLARVREQARVRKSRQRERDRERADPQKYQQNQRNSALSLVGPGHAGLRDGHAMSRDIALRAVTSEESEEIRQFGAAVEGSAGIGVTRAVDKNGRFDRRSAREDTAISMVSPCHADQRDGHVTSRDVTFRDVTVTRPSVTSENGEEIQRLGDVVERSLGGASKILREERDISEDLSSLEQRRGSASELSTGQVKRERWLRKVEAEGQASLTTERWAKLVEGMSWAEREAFILRGRKFRLAIQAQLDTLSARINAREAMRKVAERKAQAPLPLPQGSLMLPIEGGRDAGGEAPMLPHDLLPDRSVA